MERTRGRETELGTGEGSGDAITAVFDIDLPDFDLTRSKVGDIILEDMSAYSGSRMRLFVWLRDADCSSREALSGDPYVDDFRMLLSNQNASLYRLVGAVQSVLGDFYEVLVGGDSLLLEARIGEDGWTFWTLVPDRRSINAFQDWSERNGLDFSLKRIHGSADVGYAPYGLSDAQYEILRAAFETGYYEIPREGTLSTLAEEIGISDQAASERMRRAIKKLLEHTVATTYRG